MCFSCIDGERLSLLNGSSKFRPELLRYVRRLGMYAFKNKFFKFPLYTMQHVIPSFFPPPSHNIKRFFYYCFQVSLTCSCVQSTHGVHIMGDHKTADKVCCSKKIMSQLPGFKQHVTLLVLANLCETFWCHFPQVCVPNVSCCPSMVSSSHSAVHMHLQAPVLLFMTDTTRSCDHFSSLKYERRRIMWNWP